jgi:hypothetical protein
MKETGWRPEIPFKQSLFDLLQYWRAKLGKEREDSRLEQLRDSVFHSF